MKALLAGLLASSVALGCGTTVPYGGVPREPAPNAAPGHVTTVTSATDLIPADLDLVVRLDLAKVRSDLGPEAATELIAQALNQAGTLGIARATLMDAEVVWLGLRIADLDDGDHVMVVRYAKRPKAPPDTAQPDTAQPDTAPDTEDERPPSAAHTPDPAAWTASSTGVASMKRFVSKARAPRGGTALLFTVGEDAVVFASPVEEQSVERVLRMGPDADRGEPRARGLLSVDLREPRLAATLEKEVPALAGLIASIQRVHATVDLFGENVELEGTIRCRDAASANRVAAYLTTFTNPSTRFADILNDAEATPNGATVSVRWRAARAVLSQLLHSDRDTLRSP